MDLADRTLRINGSLETVSRGRQVMRTLGSTTIANRANKLRKLLAKTIARRSNCRSEYIAISKPRKIGNKLEVELDVSSKLKEYFFSDVFSVEYDTSITSIDDSVLTIPPTLTVAPVAWATGANIYVERLDEACLRSLDQVRRVFLEMYPRFSRYGRVCVRQVVKNEFRGKRLGLLFSGGLDSLSSYISHRDRKPVLITMLRGDSPYFTEWGDGKAYWDVVEERHRDFAKEEGATIRFIRSNVWDEVNDTLNNSLLESTFEVGHWWQFVSHGLMLLGLCAPLTAEGIGKIIMASAYTRPHKTPHGAHFLAEVPFSWADASVIYDGQHMTRDEKVRYSLKGNTRFYKYLRVCGPLANSSFYKNLQPSSYHMNCGSCEKCLRTLTALILYGIDPVDCNFDVSCNVLDQVRELLITDRLPVRPGDRGYLVFWKEIQDHIPNAIKENEVHRRYKARVFFDWLRTFDLMQNEPRER